VDLIAPAFRVSANSKDITDAIADRLISLRLTDELGFQSDMLEIRLADHDQDKPIQKPPKGAELEVWLGYDGNVQRMGLFVADEIERGGWPRYMTIRARAAVYDKTPKGKTDLQTQKVRSWPDKTKLGDMVQKIAKEHGMEAVVAKSLASVTLPHLDQTEESDISFLVRVTRQYDAVVKPAGGKLVLAKRGESDLPSVSLDAIACTSFHLVESAREASGTVVAYWHNKKSAKRIEVKVGSGDPVKRLRHFYPTEDAAKAAAQGDMDRRQRAEAKLSLTMPGNPNVQAEGKLSLASFGDGIDGEWLVVRVEHELDPRAGYSCHVSAEKPKDAE
jgi:phage protein D